MSVVLHCRTCTRACKDYKSLFEMNIVQENDDTTLAELLQYCTNLPISLEDTDGMPQHICHNCIQLLEQALHFKRMVLESDDLLRQGLQETNNDYIMIEMVNDGGETETVETDKYAQSLETVEAIDAFSDIDVEYVDPDVDAVEVITQDDVHEATMLLESDVCEIEESTHLRVEYVDIKHEVSSFITDCVEEVETEEADQQEIDEIEKQWQEVVVEEETETEPKSEPAEEEYIQEDRYVINECDEDYEEEEEELDEDSVNAKLLANLPYVCEVCGKGFRQQCRLRQHMQAHNSDKLFTCEVCGKKLKHLKNYKEHMITHTNIKPHQCNVCHRFYRTTSSLAAHKRTHADQKPYKCDMCSKDFTAYDHMRRHKLTHTGERPYSCNLCDKAYYDSSSLRTHMVSHGDEKPFKCEICGKGITQKSGYKRHMLVHSGQKPHKCPICDRAFTFTSNLNAHVRLHSGEKPFVCDKCPKCFPTKKRLQSHQRVHNKEQTTLATDSLTLFERRKNLMKDGHKPNNLPDVPDQQVSRSKVVVVL